MSKLSLLYPEGYDRNQETISKHMAFFDELRLGTLVKIPAKQALPWNTGDTQFTELFTSNSEVIRYRLDVLDDLIRNSTLCDCFREILPQIELIAQLRTDKQRATDTTQCLYSISEIEMYTDCVDLLYDAIAQVKDIKSAGLSSLFTLIKKVHESDEYIKLKQNSQALMKQTRSIRSVTIGVNLDAQLNALEAGVVSVNSEYFRSGDIIDRMLRLDKKDDGFRCLTPLIPYGKNRADQKATSFNSAVNNAIDIIFRSAVRRWRPLIRRYLVQNTDYIVSLAKDIRFLLIGVEFINKMHHLRVPMCKPDVCDIEDKAFDVKGLYNPHIALDLGEEEAKNIVYNNLKFDQNGMIYILTGANQGGKTAITAAVGISQALFQLGFFVPARSAKISPVDNIFVHISGREGAAIGKGRLGEECNHLRQTLEAASQYSLVLMDEALSSTSAIEASYIASEVLIGFSIIGLRGIFATHLHDLAQKIDELNSNPDSRVKLDNLVATVDSASNKRSFIISRTKPEGLSYAKSIAEKYGITLEQIKKRI